MHELIPPAVNFTILVVGLFVLLRKPVREMVANRRTLIKTQVDEAQAQKLEAQRRYREFADKLQSFEAEAKSILERAQVDAKAERERILAEARATADRIVKDADATAQSNIQEYKDQIRRETIAKAVEIAEKTIRERLSSDDQRRMINEYVGKVQQQ